MKILQEKIENQYKKQLPFVVYNKPNSKEVFGMFQENATLNVLDNRFDRQGFVFAPFDTKGKTILIPLDASELLCEQMCASEQVVYEHGVAQDTVSKSIHIDLIKKGVAAIKENQFKKVVLSRKQGVKIAQIDIVKTYTRLLHAYPNAFVYVWFHPKVGLWFGATPETLLQLKENQFTTMSLAGTQVYNKHAVPVWSQKEIDEQGFVTNLSLIHI